jgi:uncharacterized protein YraI
MLPMKLIKLISTVFIGLGITLAVENSALAGSFRGVTGVTGVYSDGNLTVQVNPIILGERYSTGSNSYYYSYRGSLGGKSIEIVGGAKNFGSNSRHVYTWDNNGTKYQVVWKPSDPEYIRVRVISGGREVLNRVIREITEDPN